MTDQELETLVREHVHLTDAEFEACLDGSLPASVKPGIEKHLNACLYCQEDLAIARAALAECGFTM